MPRGEPYSTGNIPKTTNLVTTKGEDLLGLKVTVPLKDVTTKGEDLLGLKVTVPLKDVVEESVKDFKLRSYPGFAA